MAHFEDAFWAGSGFDDLHRFMKQGNDFCREFESILSERAELENHYTNGLHKLAKKSRKASKRCIGSLEVAWQKLIAGLELEEETHRSLNANLTQDCVKVLKVFTEQQVKQREPVEAAVEKGYKYHMDKRKQQLRNKKNAHKTCKDLEGNWEQLEDVKNNRGKPMSDKDIQKLEKSCRKLEQSLIRSDREYRDSNLKTEEARLAWESAMYRCCRTMESLECERLQQVQSMLTNYSQLVETIVRPTEQLCEELLQACGEISPESDIPLACSTSGTGPNQPEQLLMGCYEEDLQNPMSAERRQTSLEKKIQWVEEEIERQQRAKAGVEQLAKVYQEQPDFCDEKGAQDVSRQLVEADAIINLLKANHYKLLESHADLTSAVSPTSHFSDYITTSKDKQNQLMSVLKIPVESIGSLQQDYSAVNFSDKKWKGKAVNGGRPLEESDEYVDMQEAEGGTLEFDQYDDEYDFVGQCEAMYEYEAMHEDELTLSPGDVISVIDKTDDNWWHGQLNGQVGIFPASYVEERT